MNNSQFSVSRFASIKFLVLVTILILFSNYHPTLAQTTETNPKNWIRYSDKDFGIAFRHPINWYKHKGMDWLTLHAPEDRVGPVNKPEVPSITIQKYYGSDVGNIWDLIKSKKVTRINIGDYTAFEFNLQISGHEYGWLSTIFKVEKDKLYFWFFMSPYGEDQPWGIRMKNIFQKFLENVEFY